VRFPAQRCAPRRLRVRPLHDFTPARTLVRARGRVIARRAGARPTLRLPRLRGRTVTLRVEVVFTEGSRLLVSRAYRVC
jgi:hypothetical protein